MNDPDSRLGGDRLEAVFAKSVEVRPFDFDDIFGGFKRIRIATYSWSVRMMLRLATSYSWESFVCVFGSGNVMPRSAEEVIAFQKATGEQTNVEFMESMSPEQRTSLLSLRDAGGLSLWVVKDAVSHAKIYLLETDEGEPRRRVVIGSANMSEVAFSGKQAETVTVYDDDDLAWEHYSGLFDAILATAAQQFERSAKTEEIVAEELHILPVAIDSDEARERGQKVVVHVPSEVADEESPGPFVERMDKHREVLAKSDIGFQTRSNGVAISPPDLSGRLRQVTYTQPGEKETIANLTRDGDWLTLNGVPMKRDASDEDVRNDVGCFLEHFENYANVFQGDVAKLQRDYFALMAWLFQAPFNCDLRRTTLREGGDPNQHPRFAIVYGASNCGKTVLIETLMKAMFGFEGVLDASRATPRWMLSLEASQRRLPVVYDDIDRKRLNDAGAKVMKRDGAGPPEIACMVFSANAEAKAFKTEITKRALMVYTDTSLPGNEIGLRRKQHRKVIAIRQRMTQSLFTCFAQAWTDRLWGDDPEPVEDSLRLATETLVHLFERHLRPGVKLPDWCRPISFDEHQSTVYENGRLKMGTQLAASDYRRNGTLVDGQWSVSQEGFITKKVSAFTRSGTRDDIPDWLIDEARSTSNNIVMPIQAVEEFMGRSVVPRRHPIARLFRLGP